jgi:hypothetical protein
MNRALLLMKEHGIEEITDVDADTLSADERTVTTATITRDDVAKDEDAADLVCAIIAKHNPKRLAALAPTLIVSLKHLEECSDASEDQPIGCGTLLYEPGYVVDIIAGAVEAGLEM